MLPCTGCRVICLILIIVRYNNVLVSITHRLTKSPPLLLLPHMQETYSAAHYVCDSSIFMSQIAS